MKRLILSPLFLGLLLLVVLAGFRTNDSFIVETLRNLAFDQMQRMSPRQPAVQPVRIIDIDEAALRRYGQWPWARDVLARMTDRLGELGAAVVVFDIAFVEQDRLSPKRLIGQFAPATQLPDTADTDQQFADSLSRIPSVLGFGVTPDGSDVLAPPKSGFAMTGDNPMAALSVFEHTTPVLPILADAAAGIGSMSLTPGRSSAVVRQIPLLLLHGNKAYPSLAMEALRVAQNANGYLLRGADDVDPAVEDIVVGEFLVPTNRHGEFWLHYRPDDPALYISAADILADKGSENLADKISGHIVLIGTSATGLLDLRTTTLGENVPGVSIHAQVLEQILSGQFLHRPDWIDGAEILLLIVLGAVVVVITSVLPPVISLLFGAVALMLLLAGSWFGFRYGGYLIDPSFNLLAIAVVQFLLVGYRYLVSDRDARFISTAFSRYVSPNVLAEIRKDPAKLQLGGEERLMSIMFVDIRNFTPLSEGLEPTDLVLFLNQLLDELSQCVTDHDGTIDKYIGDCIMAFWNAPLNVADHQIKACQTAVAMRQKLTAMNARDAFGFKAKGYDFAEIKIGIGINSGLACVGNLGSHDRFDYSVIGDAVNLAARIESVCKVLGSDIVVSAATAEHLGHEFALLPAGSIALKGKTHAQQLYVIAGDKVMRQSSGFQELSIAHQALLDNIIANKDFAKELATCQQLVASHMPGLVHFYQLVPQRLNDFKN